MLADCVDHGAACAVYGVLRVDAWFIAGGAESVILFSRLGRCCPEPIKHARCLTFLTVFVPCLYRVCTVFMPYFYRVGQTDLV